MIPVISEKSLGNSEMFDGSRKICALMKAGYDSGNIDAAKEYAAKLIDWEIPSGTGIAYDWAITEHKKNLSWASKILNMTQQDLDSAIHKYTLGHQLKALGLRKTDPEYKGYLKMLMTGSSLDDIEKLMRVN